MKTPFALAASLSAILLMAGCRESSPPVPASDQSPVAPQGSTSTPNSPEQASGTAAGAETGADQTDDPGMTADHDKTVKQEQPSGDESSRAAPNDGDAEPPR